jgi:hypothetical protein
MNEALWRDTLVVLGVTLCCIAGGASGAAADLTPALTETGRIFFSIDGLGTTDPAGGVIEVQKPAGATTRKAFLSCAAVQGVGAIPNGTVTLAGTPITWNQNITSPSGFGNTFADVTTVVKPTIDAAAPGRIPFTVVEANPFAVDGCALGVVLDDPGQTRDSAVIVLFGGQNTLGDSFAITLAQPLDLSSPSSRADMGLAISFSAQDQSGVGGSHLCGVQSAMDSQVDVNGQRLTSCAGNIDDGVGTISDGMLLTVGGLDDSNDNPADPLQRAGDSGTPRVKDDELYNLKPFVKTGDTLIMVNTVNPSNDDNIFLAYFVTSVPAIVGEGIVLAPPSATNPVGTSHTVTATVVDNVGQPIAGRLVSFMILSGPDAGENGSANTGADGKASFTYVGSSAGTDTIQASMVDSTGVTRLSNIASKQWQVGGTPTNPAPTLSLPLLILLAVSLGITGLFVANRRVKSQ